jgi:hypothetical protein
MNDEIRPITTTLSRIESYSIPNFPNGSGLIHSVVCDGNGAVFFSDEINHAVISLRREGTVHWVNMGKGSAPAKFHYPRGLALGKAWFEGNYADCLAVCDAWNHRVQFFGLDGSFLGEWDRAGDELFSEPTDIRYLKTPGDFSPGEETESWIVLDKSHHCLYVFGADGSLQSSLGRPLPGKLQTRWTLPEIRLENGIPVPGTMDVATPMDFLFYPERFLGEKNGTLYILESNSYDFKGVIGKYFLPIHIHTHTEQAIKWISIDSSFLVGWNRNTDCLLLQNHSGTTYLQASVHGNPIPSNVKLNEIFIQNDALLEKYVWKDLFSDAAVNESEKNDTLLIRSAQTEFQRLDIERIQELLESFLTHVDSLLNDADIILAMGTKNPDKDLLESTLKHLQTSRIWRQKHFHSFNETIFPLCLGMLESNLLGIPAIELAGNITHSMTGWKHFEDIIREKFTLTRKKFDEICEMHLRRNIPDSHPPEYVESWNHIVANAQYDMDESLKFLKRLLFNETN